MSKVSKISEAYARSKIARDALYEVGARCMEVTEDKVGIVWERFIIGAQGTSVVLFCTPHWWDVFVPLTSDQHNDAVVEAIKELAQRNAKQAA